MSAPHDKYFIKPAETNKPKMNTDHGSFYIDGSHLFQCIEIVRRDHPELSTSKLNIQKFADYLIQSYGNNFHSSVRVTFYVRKEDPRIKTHLTVPNLHGQRGHWQIKQCGQNIKNDVIPADQLARLDEKYRDMYPRAEKGLDMELACDALSLAANHQVQCFVFMINDRDYIPLLQSIQRFGANPYIVGLDVRQKVQGSLLELADNYVTLEPWLNDMFDYQPPAVEPPGDLVGE